MIFICTTLWHEEDNEMRTLLTSLLRNTEILLIFLLPGFPAGQLLCIGDYFEKLIFEKLVFLNRH